MTLLGGMILGSAIAMMLTPQSGPELRHNIKHLMDKGADKLHEKIREMEEKIDTMACRCNE